MVNRNRNGKDIKTPEDGYLDFIAGRVLCPSKCRLGGWQPCRDSDPLAFAIQPVNPFREDKPRIAKSRKENGRDTVILNGSAGV